VLVRRLIGEPGGLDAAAEVLSSRLIQRLRELQAAQSRDFAELSATLLPGHPRMRQLRAEQAELESRITQEINKIAQGLENEANITASQVSELREQLETYKREASDAKAAEVRLRALERESASQRDLLESFLRRYREASARVDLPSQPANARIISRATVASSPSYPKVLPILALTGVAAVLLGLVAAFLVEQFAAPAPVERDHRLRARSHPLVRTGRPAPDGPGATIGEPAAEPGFDVGSPDPAPEPEPEPEFGPEPEPALAVGADIHDRFAVAVRQVGRRIARLCTSRGYRRLLVVDFDGADERDVAILDIARVLGKAGHRTVLIELTGQSRIAALAGLPPHPGMAELLAGRAGLAEVVAESPNGNVSLITDGLAPLPMPVPAERFARILGALGKRYDVVVALAGSIGSGALALSAEMDFTLVTVSPGTLKGEGLRPGLARLREQGVGEAAVMTTGPDGVNLYEAIGVRDPVSDVA
jgi:hypothetical protein